MSFSRAARRRRPMGSVSLLALAALLAALFTAFVAPTGTAQAAAYRFWGYNQLKGGSWAYAQKGPAQMTPKDGSVEGWRFALGDGKTPRFPRATPTFAEICGDTPVAAGHKRVAVVIDYGRPADAPTGAKPPAARAACASVDTAATGADVLAAVAGVRMNDKGLTCGIDGYPPKGCGDTVKTIPAAARAADQPVTLAKAGSTGQSQSTGGVSIGTWVGIAVVIVVAAAVIALALRRRRRA